MVETMPTNMSNVFIDQKNNMDLGYSCDNRPAHIPQVLDVPDKNDYLTDEESDEAADFEVKVPELDDLLTQFEAEDTTILEMNQKQKAYVKDLVTRGFEPESRHDIIDTKGEQK